MVTERGTSEAADADALARELAALHRGRGLRRSRLSESVGPQLRAVLDLADDVDEAHLRLTVADALIAAARGLAPDLRAAFLYASAARSEERLLQDRLNEVGKAIDRDPRTVRRRLENANHAVAAELLARHERQLNHPLAPTGWTVVAMAASLDLRPVKPRFSARKTILAGQRLSVLTDSVSIPRPDDDTLEPEIEVEVHRGGELSRLDRVAASSWRYQIDFGDRLDSGDLRTIEVTITVPSDRYIAPYNVLVPLRPCAQFDASVEFPPDRLPPLAQRVDGVSTPVLNDRIPPAFATPVSPSMSASFTALVPGLAYGLRWSY